MKPYRSGRVVEYACKDRLYMSGAKLVVRSAASKTPIDLIAFFPDKGEIWLVQVKKGRGRLRKEERKALKELRGSYRVKAVIYHRPENRYVFEEIT